MREYIYIPLGGNRISAVRTYINLWLVFLISGFWHGANWNFIVWGAFHGLFLVFDKLFWLKISMKFSKYFNIFITFVIVMVSWAFFRIENIASASMYVIRMFDLSTWFMPVAIRWTEVLDYRLVTLLILSLFICLFPATKSYKRLVISLESFKDSYILIYKSLFSVILLVLSLMSLVNATFNPFIYFRF